MRAQSARALPARRWRCELQIFDAERVQQAGDLVLLPAVEEGVGELLALAQRRFYDSELFKTHAYAPA